MNYVPKKNRKSNYFLVVSFLVAMAILIVCAFLYVNRDQAPVDPFSICSTYSAEKSRAIIKNHMSDKTTSVSDFSYYGETVGLYKDPFKINQNDWMNGKTVFLTNLCDNKPEQAYILDRVLDGKIPVHQLDVGFYKIEVLDVLNRYQLVSEKPFQEVFETMARGNGVKRIELVADHALMTGSQTAKADKHYVYLKVSYAPTPNHVDVVLDPYGFMLHANGEVQYGAASNGLVEGEVTYQLAKDIQKQLEKHGLSVKIAREARTPLNVFGTDGRIANAYEDHALYYVQLRTPYGWTAQEIGATVLYPASSSNRLAQSILRNIEEKTSLRISTWKNNNNRTGVYQASFDGAQEKNDLFRETGGSLTGAGLDADFGLSQYKDLKYGMQSVMIEYGYVTDVQAVNAFETEHGAIVEATVQGILESLGVLQ